MTGFSRRTVLSVATSSLAWALSARPALPVPAPAARRRAGEARFTSDLHAHLGKLAAQDDFSGVVLIAKGDRIAFEQAYGWADQASSVPNRVATKFNIASMGKMFTAIATLQLAQQGRLSVNDHLQKLVPDYPDKDIGRKITVFQLLTHTSGLTPLYNFPQGRFDSAASLVALFGGKPLDFEPGTQWSYSNAGFIVLGLIIERVSEQSYYDYVRSHIFEPAGMLDTGNFAPDENVPNLALGYSAALRPGLGIPGGAPPKPRNVAARMMGLPAGGAYSTARDILQFSTALQEGKLLDREFTDLAITGKVATDRPGVRYGFGMYEELINGVRLVGHSGGGGGMSSNLDMYPDLGYTVVVLTNLDGNHYLANERIRMSLTGQKIPTPVRLPADALHCFAGTYAIAPPPSGGSGGVRIRPGDTPPQGPGGLRAPPAAAGGPAGGGGPVLEIAAGTEELWLTSTTRIRMLPLSQSEFFSDNVPTVRIAFHQDENGRVAGLALTVPGYPLITASRTS